MPFANDIILGCVCLEVKQDEWKTLERKWEGKLFWSVFDWIGRKINGEIQMFSLQNGEKTEWRWIFSWLTKMPMCMCTLQAYSSWPFFFPSPLGSNVAPLATLPLIFIFIFFYSLLLLFFFWLSRLGWAFFSFDFLGLERYFFIFFK